LNIFVISDNPLRNARVLDNKRVVKMVLETAQLLSNYVHHIGQFTPYKKTHWNHPCSVWVRESPANYRWLCSYFKELCDEYSRRYSREHKCAGLLPLFFKYVDYSDTSDMTPFKNCTDFKDLPTFAAYRMALKTKWKNDKLQPSWKSRNSFRDDKCPWYNCIGY
jgi:Pyrimidine dimer DNA glycosylase